MGPVASHTRAGGYVQYCEKRSVASDLPTRTHLIIDNPESYNPNKAHCDPTHHFIRENVYDEEIASVYPRRQRASA